MLRNDQARDEDRPEEPRRETGIVDGTRRSTGQSADPGSLRRFAGAVSDAFIALKQVRLARGLNVIGVDVSVVPLLMRLTAGDLSIGEAATCLSNDMSTVSRQVSHLVRAGLAIKTPDPGDRRSVRVSVTDAGRRAAAEILQRRTDWLSELLHDWSGEDVDRFTGYLERLTEAAQAEITPR